MKKSDIVLLRFENGGLFSSKGNWIHGERVINSYELIIVTRGTVYIREGAKECALGVGDYILLHPDLPHGGTRVSDKPVEFYWLHFTLDSIGGFPPPHDIIRRITPLCSGTLSEPSILIQNARQLLQCSNSPEYTREISDHLMYIILDELLVQRERETPQNAFAARIHEYIRSYAHLPLTVSGVADALGYHPDHLSRVLKNCYGFTLKQDIAAQRVIVAKQMLQTTDLTVSQISMELGFADPNLFEKFFRYHTKTTPTAFRNGLSKIHTNHI